MRYAAEQCLQEVILPDLERGRPDWDKPHTEAVVAYTKEILVAQASITPWLDGEVLVIAAYAHDWRYANLFQDGQLVDRGAVKDRKAQHMKLGTEKLATLLRAPVFNYLSDERKGRACHLVFVHDAVKHLKALDELVLMEADTLAAFDPKVPSTYSYEEKEAWKAEARLRRVQRFTTGYSRRKIKELELAAQDGHYGVTLLD